MLRVALFTLVLVITGIAVHVEMRRSVLQAHVFTHWNELFTWTLEDGPSHSVAYPEAGPYNERLGYSQLPERIEAARAGGYQLLRQTRFSPELLQLIEYGGYPIYDEKARAGLTITDPDGVPLYSARYPRQVFSRFDDIPALIRDTLLFIENRELLRPAHPHQNPAIEWRRLGAAIAMQAVQTIRPGLRADGGSTLATQTEKYRHSPHGATQDARDKLRQMVQASLRAYRDGPDTRGARQHIVLDYLNSTPLAGRVGFGEVHGLGDGLWAWFGMDLNQTNELLRHPPDSAATAAAQAHAYRHVLALLLAQRRPSWYLRDGREELEELTDSYLRIIHQAGLIDLSLRDQALATRLNFPKTAPPLSPPSFVDHKAINSVRYKLLQLLQASDLYALDRLDLSVETTFHATAQDGVNRHLRQLHHPEYAQAQGLYGRHLLQPNDPIEHIHYSVVIYERTDDGNYLRVQTDNFDQPLDMNEGTMLDLGSTAKLRTLVTYLEIVDELYQRLAPRSTPELWALTATANDVLTRWVATQLATTPSLSLSELLDRAMARTYSASPHERFYTGGGVHTFSNFDRLYDHRQVSLNEAFRHSINLVFIRLMRDIVRYEIARQPELFGVLNQRDHPARRKWLQRFAATEGLSFLNRFIAIYQPLTPEQRLERLGERTRKVPYRLAMAYRAVRPDGTADELADFMRRHLGQQMPDENEIQRLYQHYHPDRFDLNDQGFITKVHPLELWLLRFMHDHPEASRADIRTHSADARQEVYAWLFRTSRVQAQQQRLRMMVEEEAFKSIHQRWQRLGYPFSQLVPSYASSIGASADRPAALAELMGIIVNDGKHLPFVRIRTLHFAAETPYEVFLSRRPEPPQPLLAPEVAARLRTTLIDAVEEGTGRRLKDTFVDAQGHPLAVGSKTGTGDHRFKRINRYGHVIESEVRGRNATLMFFIGDRFFGTVAAHVSAPHAERFRFTSALPAQILRTLEPALRPMLTESDAGEAVAGGGVSP